MAVAPQLIHLPDAFVTLDMVIAEVRRINMTMMNYYVHPDPVPTEIVEFQPGMDRLAERIESLSTLSVPNLTLLIDDAACWVIYRLVPLVAQFAASVRAFQGIFIEFYDRQLERRVPYAATFNMLKQIEDRLRFSWKTLMEDPRKRPAEHLTPPPSANIPLYCRSAVAFTNSVDHGKVFPCLPKDLTSENKAKLKSFGGVFLWWECPTCAFRLRFHVNSSASASINTTDEVRAHDDIEGIEYRSSWLAKCHLYHPGRELHARDRDRRRSESFSGGKQSKSQLKSVNATAVGGVKYGCQFCFAIGDELEPGRTAFSTAKEFALHVLHQHTDGLPNSLLLQRLKVGINGKMAEGVKRWDLHILP